MNNKNFSIWSEPILDPSTFNSLDDKSQLLYLCRLAHLAPSTHNTQPWKFLLDKKEKKIKVYLDRNLVLPVSDIVGRQAVISIGCAIENMLIGAEYLGLECELKIFEIKKNDILHLPKNSKNNNLTLIAAASFFRSKPKKELSTLYNSIFSRKVTRAEFDPTKIVSKEVINSIKNISEDYSIDFNFISDPVRRITLSEFQGQADSFVINSKKFAKELGDWLLPNDTDSYFGMPGIGFGLQDDEAKRMNLALSGKIDLEPEDGLRFASGGKVYLEKSPLIGLLLIKKDEPRFWLQSGRCFQKIFLSLESIGVCVAIHAAIVEVNLVNRIFTASLGSTKKLCVLFRAGYVKNKKDLIRPHSPRQSLQMVILD